MLFIYTPHDSPRIEYALDFIFGSCLKTPVSQVEDLREVPAGAPLLVYSYVRPDRPAVWLFPHDLPLGFSIESHRLNVFEYNGHPAFFRVEEAEGADLPYDPIALVFFMLSRYEEYLSTERDEYGRFPATASVAHRYGFLEHPVADQAVEDLRLLLAEKWPGLAMETGRPEDSFTYDVDAPFAFYGKPWWKNLAGGLRDAFTFGRTGRLAYALGRRDDPFDIFGPLLEQLAGAGVRATFFLLLEHRGKHNPGIDHRDARFRDIVHRLGERHALGIHPSYDCHDARTLHREMDRFEAVTGCRPEHSRFHFIRMHLPESYHLVYGSGLFHEHSMAFPDHFGFRAGTTRSFRFYDLSGEAETDLEVHPFCFMDATFEYYMKGMDEAELLDRIRSVTARIRASNGRVSWVFHHDLLSAHPSAFDWAKIHKMALEGGI